MLEKLTYLCLIVTLGFTGYYAVIFIRNPEAAMRAATHRLELLPRVMTGRYVVLFLFTGGVIMANDLALTVYFFAVCTFLGLYDGFLYWRRGLPHLKHTSSGVLSLGALIVSGLALAQQRGVV